MWKTWAAIKKKSKNINTDVQIFPPDYQHPIMYDGRIRKRVLKEDRKFIERQMKVPGYRCELGTFYFIYNDPRVSWI